MELLFAVVVSSILVGFAVLPSVDSHSRDARGRFASSIDLFPSGVSSTIPNSSQQIAA
jgi:Tfp pilus assembly protein FimT